MLIYPSLLGLSLIGIFVLTRRYYNEAKILSQAELRLRLKAGISIRSRIWTNFLHPLFIRIKNASLPAILNSSEYVVKQATGFVVSLEKKLKHLADTIHGKAIKLDVPEKTEYWNNLNNAKGNGQPAAEMEAKKEVKSAVVESAKIESKVEEPPKVTRGRPKRIILK